MKTKIQQELEKQGKTIYFLHRKIGGNRTNVYETVKGYARATIPMREKIAEVLDVPVEELFNDDGTARREEN